MKVLAHSRMTSGVARGSATTVTKYTMPYAEFLVVFTYSSSTSLSSLALAMAARLECFGRSDVHKAEMIHGSRFFFVLPHARILFSDQRSGETGGTAVTTECRQTVDN